MASTTDAKAIADSISESIRNHQPLLSKINKEIHSNPELGYEEHLAHDTICNALEELGYKVTRHAHGLKTAFEIESGEGGPLVAYNAEYDALPGIGHACGHNLITTSTVGAFLANAEALKKSKIPGRVRIIGTPAEENFGGKVDLIRAGAYKNVDACLMGHAFGPSDGYDGVVLPRMMARCGLKVTFQGKNAHAGNAPWHGINALDAAVQAYNALSMLRQQTPPNRRIHAVITNGGDRPNIIPHESEMSMYARAETIAEAEDTANKLVKCCQAAADATGCTMEVEWTNSYKELECSKAIAARFLEEGQKLGQSWQLNSSDTSGGSTDQGNVSYEVPSLHPFFVIPVPSPEIGPHHPHFEQSAGSEQGFTAALKFATTLAATGMAICSEEPLRDEMRKEFKQTFGSK